MSLEPPPNTGTRSGCQRRLRLLLILESGDVNSCARRGRHERGVRVKADEDVRLVVVGQRDPLIERNAAIVFTGHQHPQPEPGLDGSLDAARHGQRQVFLDRPAFAAGADIVATVAGVDHDRPKGCGLTEHGQFRRCRRL